MRIDPMPPRNDTPTERVSKDEELLALDHETLKDLDATGYIVGGVWTSIWFPAAPGAPVSGQMCNQNNNPGAATSAT